MRSLKWAAVPYAIGFLGHNLDHLRRGFGGLTTEVLIGGTILSVLAVTTLALVLFDHRLAPAVAVLGSFPAALGVTATHLLPHWSAFSDAFPGNTVSPLSYIAVIGELAGLLAMGFAGLHVLRRQLVVAPA
jgi:hypothetical protein